jgi:rhodanese-related sulfurtransferase
MTAIRTLHQTLALSGAGLALLAAAVGTPTPLERRGMLGAADSTPRVVGARQLAAWIRDGGQPVRVLDLRGDSAYASRHVPSAEPADFATLDTLAKQRDETLVLYSDDDVRDAQAWANLEARGHRDAYVLSGGMQAWTEEVMEATLRGDSADYVAALSRYFGGTPRSAGDGATPVREARSEAPERAEGALSRDASPEVRRPDERPSVDAFGDSERRGC